MKKFKRINIAGICINICSGGTPKSTYSEYYGGNIPWLNTKEVNFNRIYETEKMITLEGLENSSAKWIEKNSIIVAMYGATAGKCAISKIPLTTNQACCNLKIDPQKADYRFVFYALFNDYQRLSSLANGGAQQNLNTQRIKEFDIPYPAIEKQIEIADILSSLDDKIELNNRINDNLEQQTVLLFYSWFSSFSQSQSLQHTNSEFGVIPSNFSVMKVGNLPMFVTDYVANGSFASLKENVTLYQEPNYAYFVRNTDLKSDSFGVYVDQHSYEFLSKSTLYGGEIIISNVGDVGSVFLCPKLDRPMTLGNNIIMLRPDDDSLRYYLYIWFKYFQGRTLIQGIKGGSAQPKFNKKDFKNTSILLPPAELLFRFHETVAPMFVKINENQSENKRLSDLRDTLLPRLMSGEIDVSSVKI